jgi:hypothetical protein
MFTQQQLAVVRFCAEECKRQKTGPRAVSWMVNAYHYAASVLRPILAAGGKLEMEHILTLAEMIEPADNRIGFRIVDVRFADGTVLDNHHIIPDQVARLLSLQAHTTPGQFYQEFEEIHPFTDGNGREGAILFNLLGDTLDNPVVPPHFKRGHVTYESAFGKVED